MEGASTAKTMYKHHAYIEFGYLTHSSKSWALCDLMYKLKDNYDYIMHELIVN